MTKNGVDYSVQTPGSLPAALKSEGISFVMRYLSLDAGKNLHRAEAELLGQHGIHSGVVWETAAQRTLAGHAAGAQDAQQAAEQAKACGMPPGRPIYFAVDFDATPDQKPVIRQYLEGAGSVLGGPQHVGVYGGYWVVKDCFDHKVVDWGWQTVAWSGGNRDERAQLFQHYPPKTIGGVQVDLDTAYADDHGGWLPH